MHIHQIKFDDWEEQDYSFLGMIEDDVKWLNATYNLTRRRCFSQGENSFCLKNFISNKCTIHNLILAITYAQTTRNFRWKLFVDTAY